MYVSICIRDKSKYEPHTYKYFLNRQPESLNIYKLTME